MPGTHYKTLIDSDWLGQHDLTDAKTGRTFEPTVEIASVKRYVSPIKRKKRMPDGSYKDEPSRRLDIAFVGKRKHWLAGPVSQKTIEAMYGAYVEDWLG